MRYHSLVIGAGPAGLTAAMYLARYGLSVALVEKLSPGGLLLQTSEIENYPGFPKGVKGYELADAFADQASAYDITRLGDEVTATDLSGAVKRVRIGQEWVEAETVVICTGVRYRKLGLPGEDGFIGRGISFCALCDGHFFRDQVVAVVGGGNSALEEALYLARITSRVHLIHRRREFRAAAVYAERVRNQPNIVIEEPAVITGLQGEGALESLTLQRVESGREDTLAVNGLFVFIGFDPVGDFLPAELARDAQGFIETDKEMRTNIPGVFAAGDICSKLCRQVVTAVGDGATAANSAYLYLDQQHG